MRTDRTTPASEPAAFGELGFARLAGIVPAAELDWLREAFDRVFRLHHGVPPRDFRLSGGRAPTALATIISPDGNEPGLRSSEMVHRAHRALAELFGVPTSQVAIGWRLFLKPAGGAESAWHQDAAYRPRPHRGGTVWIPLDSATTTTSCMSFIPGSHRAGLREHHYDDDHHMVTRDVEPSMAVVCPVEPGDATAHHCLTLHQAGPNRSTLPRRAFAIVGQVGEPQPPQGPKE